jgi:hypothetical protein
LLKNGLRKAGWWRDLNEAVACFYFSQQKAPDDAGAFLLEQTLKINTSQRPG